MPGSGGWSTPTWSPWPGGSRSTALDADTHLDITLGHIQTSATRMNNFHRWEPPRSRAQGRLLGTLQPDRPAGDTSGRGNDPEVLIPCSPATFDRASADDPTSRRQLSTTTLRIEITGITNRPGLTEPLPSSPRPHPNKRRPPSASNAVSPPTAAGAPRLAKAPPAWPVGVLQRPALCIRCTAIHPCCQVLTASGHGRADPAEGRLAQSSACASPISRPSGPRM